MAYLTRKENENGYSYIINVDGEKPKALRRGKNYSYWHGKVEVWFNQYVFDTFAEIPLMFNKNEGVYEMYHTYRQTKGGASAPYEIVA